jgi:hypothetical protein
MCMFTPTRTLCRPFYSYGLSDSRWSEYNNGEGLDPAVWLINCNDGGLGVLVLLALLYQRTTSTGTSTSTKVAATLAFLLVTLFRDATLWRETVEYMWDHHRLGYETTISILLLQPSSRSALCS